MNAHPHRPTAVDDAAELARLMPAPAVPGLSADRRLMLREQLMQEMPQPSAGTPARARHRLTRRRMLWSLAPLTAVAAAVATVLTIGAVSGGTTGPAGAAPGATSSEAPSNSAGALLERYALVAEQQPADEVRDDQYVYIQSVEAWDNTGHAYESNPVYKPGPLTPREVWLSVDGTKEGLLKGPDETTPLDPNTKPNLNAPTYRYLQSLPTDPDTLLAKIHAETASPKSTQEWQKAGSAFGVIGDLLREAIAPPKVTAALYRAAAKIPGVVVINDVTDATGRHGVAVAFKSSLGQVEWIFDSTTSTFLGERVLAVDGTLAGQAAVLKRAVVDRPGQTG
jgi:hypothetical protein